jgi:hypothetical protein
MAPWAPPRERPHHVWVPEGSCFPPSYLKRYLRELHGPIGKHLPSSPLDSHLAISSKPIERPESPSRSFPLRRCASHITHHTRAPDCTPTYIPITFPPSRIRGKPRRWSLSVPPSYISTEFITRRLESQRINTITGCDSSQSDAAVVDAPSLPLPAIKVSTSTTTIAISFPGSPEPPTPTPEPLAIRRGQKMLAPLTLDSSQRANEEEYPGIPTAFLGTPSAYSPHFRLTSSIARLDADSRPISDMINTLRSQASSLKVSTPVELEACLPLLDISPSSANSLSAASSDVVPSVSEDDWAFAQDLMSRYGEQAQDNTSGQAKRRQQQAPSNRKSLTPKARSAVQTSRVRRASVPQATSTPRNRPKSSSAPRTDLAKPRYNSSIVRQLKGSRQTASNGGIMNYVPHPDSSPSSPLLSGSPSPITPSHTEALAFDSPTNSRSEFSAKRPPGILKHAKSVRFADMPKLGDARDDIPSTNQSLTNTQKGMGGPQSLPPSPLRACFVSEESDSQTSSRQPPVIPTTEVSTPVSTLDRGNSVQLAPQTVNLRGSMFNSRASSATPALSDKCPLSSNSRTVKPLSLLSREQDKEKEKENIPLALRTPRRARRSTEVDENAARRASRSESASGSRKHRLSSPLKSFLERLRA